VNRKAAIGLVVDDGEVVVEVAGDDPKVNRRLSGPRPVNLMTGQLPVNLMTGQSPVNLMTAPPPTPMTCPSPRPNQATRIRTRKVPAIGKRQSRGNPIAARQGERINGDVADVAEGVGAAEKVAAWIGTVHHVNANTLKREPPRHHALQRIWMTRKTTICWRPWITKTDSMTKKKGTICN
jgi:hypothetical protein